MRKRSGQVHSRESSATLQLTVSLLYPLLPHELLYNFLSDILKTWKRNRAILQSCIAHGFLEMCD